jgi:hypothetical protein
MLASLRGMAKSVFQAHGATAAGEPAFRKKLSRGHLMECGIFPTAGGL